MRSRGWVLAIVFIVFLYLSFSSLNSVAKSRSPRPRNDLIVRRENPFKRLNTTLLTSVLAHVQVGYVANRTPDFDTPPLLVLYSCHQGGGHCGSLEQRLEGITSAYLFGMLWDGAAVGIDMSAPVKFDWFFEASPRYMVMNPGQIQFYKERADPSTVRTQHAMLQHDLATKDYVNEYRSQNVRVLQCGNWDAWPAMQENPFMKRLRDKYRLEQLQPSEGFWVAHQLLFSKPNDWLSGHLTPYLDLLGGHMHRDPLDVLAQPPENDNDSILARWIRIGVRVTEDNVDYACIATRVASVCSKAQVMGKECHVFISASSQDIIEQLRSAIIQHKRKNRPVIVHAVAESYEFTPSSAFSDSQDDATLDPSDEPRLKLKYARPVMDWILLSRMDYLVGIHGDDFLKTSAWAAQVETDLYYHPDPSTTTQEDQCKIVPMTTW